MYFCIIALTALNFPTEISNWYFHPGLSLTLKFRCKTIAPLFKRAEEISCTSKGENRREWGMYLHHHFLCCLLELRKLEEPVWTCNLTGSIKLFCSALLSDWCFISCTCVRACTHVHESPTTSPSGVSRLGHGMQCRRVGQKEQKHDKKKRLEENGWNTLSTESQKTANLGELKIRRKGSSS